MLEVPFFAGGGAHGRYRLLGRASPRSLALDFGAKACLPQQLLGCHYRFGV